MRRKRRKPSIVEDLMDALYELTGMFWQVGAVITALLGLLTLGLTVKIHSVISVPIDPHSLVSAILTQDWMRWLAYLFPLVLGIVTYLFGLRTYRAYQESRWVP